MPSRQDDDNYQYDADTINSLGFERYRFYEKGDEGWLEIIDKETGRAVQVRDGEIRSDSMNGIRIVREEDGDDIFDAANKALAEAGSDTTVFVVPRDYSANSSSHVATTLETTAEGQRIDFLGSDVKMADGADVDPIHIVHNSCTVSNIVVDANRENNSHDRALLVDNSYDTTVEEFEFLNTPVGLESIGSRSCSFRDMDTGVDNANSETFLKVVDSENLTISDSTFTGFTNYGIWIQNSEDLLVDAVSVTTDPAGQATTAKAGLYVEGSIQSRYDIAIESDGSVENAILAEPYDIGGPDERIPTQNHYEFKIEGPRDTGIRLLDCGSEIVDGFIDGDQNGNGNTTQAFFVDSPNSINPDPAHNMDLSIQRCTRVTDTQIPAANSGMTVECHIEEITETSTFQNNGTGIFTPTFGPNLPSPVFNIETNTSVRARIDADTLQTDANGEVVIDWGDYYAFEDRPIITVQLEDIGSWYIQSYTTDVNGRYTGATIQVTNQGSAAGSNIGVLALLQGT